MRRREAIREGCIFAFGLALLIAAFETLAAVAGLPGLLQVMSGLWALWASGVLLHDVAVSGARWLSGWAIGAVLGVSLGLFTGRSMAARASLEGFLLLVRGVPFVGLLPLTIRLFGLSEQGKIGLVAWACCGTSWIIVHGRARELRPEMLWFSRTLGIRWFRWSRLILLASCAEAIRTALRTTLGLGWIVISVAEMSGVYDRSSGFWWSEGVGYRLSRTLEQSRDDQLLATILVFGLVGVVADRVLVALWVGIAATRRLLLRRRASTAYALALKRRASSKPTWPSPFPLTLDSITAGYDGQLVVRDVCVDAGGGETLVLMGASGSGKTTILRAIGQFEGDTFFHTERTPTTQRHRDGAIGYVMQDALVFQHLTVWDQIQLGSRVRSMPYSARVDWLTFIVSEFGLEKTIAHFGDELSGGQRQRVALAGAVANQPQLLLLDEPFASLDFVRRRALQQFFRTHIHGRVTTVFVTHDPAEALSVADQIFLLSEPIHSAIHVDRGDVPDSEWSSSERYSVLWRDLERRVAPVALSEPE